MLFWQCSILSKNCYGLFSAEPFHYTKWWHMRCLYNYYTARTSSVRTLKYTIGIEKMVINFAYYCTAEINS